MISFEDIRKANETIVTTGIERKDKSGKVIVKEYAEVNQRIKAFRIVHPNGSIQTDIISLNDGIVTMQTKVYSEDGVLIGTGFAQEKEESSFINKTSFIENCETSAVGRALGMCGFGIDTSVASYEEVQNAINNQKIQEPQETGKPKATAQQVKTIKTKADDLSKILKYYEVKTLEEMTIEQASHCISVLKAKEAKGE